MKVYLFDTESGIYEGEDFSDEREINEIEGMTQLAPPERKPGRVNVYDPASLTWKQVPVEEIVDGMHA